MSETASVHCPSQLSDGSDKSSAKLKLEADSLSLGTGRPWTLAEKSRHLYHQFCSASFTVESPVQSWAFLPGITAIYLIDLEVCVAL